MGAEEALSRIKMAVEFASDAISIVDASGRAVFLNRAHTELFGYDVEQLNALGGPVAVARLSAPGMAATGASPSLLAQSVPVPIVLGADPLAGLQASTPLHNQPMLGIG